MTAGMPKRQDSESSTMTANVLVVAPMPPTMFQPQQQQQQQPLLGADGAAAAAVDDNDDDDDDARATTLGVDTSVQEQPHEDEQQSPPPPLPTPPAVIEVPTTRNGVGGGRGGDAATTMLPLPLPAPAPATAAETAASQTEPTTGTVGAVVVTSSLGGGITSDGNGNQEEREQGRDSASAAAAMAITTNADFDAAAAAATTNNSVTSRSLQSRQSAATASTTESIGRQRLRRTLEERPHLLTSPERVFLEKLTVEGNDVEVELALEVLLDANIFFEDDDSKAFVVKGGNRNTEYHVGRTKNDDVETVDLVDGGSRKEEQEPQEDDATRDAAAASSVKSNSVAGSVRSSWSTLPQPPPPPPPPPALSSSNDGHVQNQDNDGDVKKPTMVVRIGSERRHQVLQARKNSGLANKLWKAHESGLAVTTSGSKASLQRRQSMESLNSTGSSRTSGMMKVANTSDSIFRVRASSIASLSSVASASSPPKRNSDLTAVGISSLSSPMKNMPPRPRRTYARSKSMTGVMQRHFYNNNNSANNLQSLRAGSLSSSGSSGNGSNSNLLREGGLPRIPEPTKMGRRSSTSSRKSVTFHDIDEEAEEDVDHAANADAVGRETMPKRSRFLRRAMSDSIQYDLPSQRDRKQAPAEMNDDQDEMKASPPTRQDSISSIPSLHHGHPVRQDSVSSIPSLHHGHPIRQDSISSIPSLHHGFPIRADSISSIPPIHHAQPFYEDSTNSIGSGMIRRGAPLRSDVSIGSVPSLHHAHPLQANQYWDEMSEDQRRSVTEEQLLRQYTASADIASAWLRQAKDRRSSLPQDVTIPISEDTPAVDPFAMEDLTEEIPLPTHAHGKPVLVRLASRNTYEGEGIEVTELGGAILDEEEEEFKNDSTADRTPVRSNHYINDVSIFSVDASIRTVNSYDDDAMSFLSGRRTSDIFRNIRKSLSDDDMSTMFLGSGQELLLNIPTKSGSVSGLPSTSLFNPAGEDTSVTSTSWEMNSEMESVTGRFDAWNIIQDDYVNGYGGGGTLGFKILGTCADDEAAQPHVLSPPLMESLQAFLPYTKSGQNFFLKYSMVRDGASLMTLLKSARGVQYSILAVETIDGEVFGSFTGQPWRKNWNYFGTGESFLWKMRRSRLEKTHGILEQASMESEIDVFPYTGENRFIQLCTHDRIAVGGGMPTSDGEKKMDESTLISSTSLSTVKDNEWGFGLAIQADMLQGSSSPCVTFGSPSLSEKHSDGSLFEIINMELWTLTPCATEEDAEKLELGKLFLHRMDDSSMQPHPY